MGVKLHALFESIYPIWGIDVRTYEKETGNYFPVSTLLDSRKIKWLRKLSLKIDFVNLLTRRQGYTVVAISNVDIELLIEPNQPIQSTPKGGATDG